MERIYLEDYTKFATAFPIIKFIIQVGSPDEMTVL